MTREEHVQYCKERAHKEIDFYNEPKQGIISLMSDLGKHPETQGHPAIQLATMFLLMGEFSTIEKARKFIDGVN